MKRVGLGTELYVDTVPYVWMKRKDKGSSGQGALGGFLKNACQSDKLLFAKQDVPEKNMIEVIVSQLLRTVYQHHHPNVFVPFADCHLAVLTEDINMEKVLLSHVYVVSTVFDDFFELQSFAHFACENFLKYREIKRELLQAGEVIDPSKPRRKYYEANDKVVNTLLLEGFCDNFSKLVGYRLCLNDIDVHPSNMGIQWSDRRVSWCRGVAFDFSGGLGDNRVSGKLGFSRKLTGNIPLPTDWEMTIKASIAIGGPPHYIRIYPQAITTEDYGFNLAIAEFASFPRDNWRPLLDDIFTSLRKYYGYQEMLSMALCIGMNKIDCGKGMNPLIADIINFITVNLINRQVHGESICDHYLNQRGEGLQKDQRLAMIALFQSQYKNKPKPESAVVEQHNRAVRLYELLKNQLMQVNGHTFKSENKKSKEDILKRLKKELEILLSRSLLMPTRTFTFWKNPEEDCLKADYQEIIERIGQLLESEQKILERFQWSQVPPAINGF